MDNKSYIKQFIIKYDPTYIEWPLELHILSYILTNNLESISLYNLELIINDVIKNNNILNNFGEKIVSSLKEEALTYFNKYINQSYEYILDDIFKYSNTWDNYSLSILFLRILIGIHRSLNVKNKFIILFMKLLVSNISLNPCKRLTIENTIYKFEILIDSLDPKDFKEIINIF